MKRHWALVLIIAAVVGLLWYGTTIATEHEQQLQEMPLEGHIVVYTDLPSNVSTIIATEYEKKYHISVQMLPLTEAQMVKHLENPKENTKGDVIITSSTNLALAARGQALGSVISEDSDVVASQFKDEHGHWVGLWYDPMVFVQNQEYFNSFGKMQTTWGSLIGRGYWTIAMPDFLATVEAKNMLMAFVETDGQQKAFAYLEELKYHVQQYAKFLSTPVRLAALNEVDIGIGPYSEAMEYKHRQYLIQVIFPQDGTPFYLMGAGMTKTSENEKEAKAFISWLLSKEVEVLLTKNHIYYIYTNPEIPRPKDSMGHELVLFKTKGLYTEKGELVILNEWLQKVRFSSK